MTLNKNNGTSRRISVILLAMVLIMSFMSFSAYAENDAKTATDATVRNESSVAENMLCRYLFIAHHNYFQQKAPGIIPT